MWRRCFGLLALGACGHEADTGWADPPVAMIFGLPPFEDAIDGESIDGLDIAIDPEILGLYGRREKQGKNEQITPSQPGRRFR